MAWTKYQLWPNLTCAARNSGKEIDLLPVFGLLSPRKKFETHKQRLVLHYRRFKRSSTTPLTVIAQIPSLLFQIGVSEMDNDQQREIIMIGFADCRRARANKISGLAVGRKDFNLSMTCFTSLKSAISGIVIPISGTVKAGVPTNDCPWSTARTDANTCKCNCASVGFAAIRTRWLCSQAMKNDLAKSLSGVRRENSTATVFSLNC